MLKIQNGGLKIVIFAQNLRTFRFPLRTVSMKNF